MTETDQLKTKRSYIFIFCDIKNSQEKGKCNQPKLKTEADNNQDLDYSVYHRKTNIISD